MPPRKIAVLAGDGIGPEVMDVALDVLRAAGKKFSFEVELTEALVGGAAYDAHQTHLPEATVEACRASQAILFGSIGGPVDAQSEPKWKDCERNSLLGLRKALQLAVNVRPSKVYEFLRDQCPLKNDRIGDGVDIVIVRELIGGIYFGKHERIDAENASDLCEYSRAQIEKAVRFGMRTAAARPKKKVTIVDKANVLETSRLWREVARDVHAQEFAGQGVQLEFLYVDNAAMQLVQAPTEFDVIVTENLFGDILSDLAAVLPNSLGLMPSASMGNTGLHMYEPSGGSAPSLAGMNVANPCAQILSVAMMLRHSFDDEGAAIAIEAAVESVLRSGVRTRDVAEKGAPVSSCSALGEAVVKALEAA